MSEKKAQAPRQYGKSCQLPKDAPDYLTQVEPNRPHPDLVKMVQAEHRRTMQAVGNLTSRPLLKDNGC